MNEISTYESRTGSVHCTAEELYHFLADMRNFGRFIPENNLGKISISKDTFTIDVNMLGKVNIRIGEMKEFSEVAYSGNAAQINDFSLVVKFLDKGSSRSEVKLSVLANLNPFLKMLAAEPMKKFLETIVAEMEKFRGWNEIRKES